MPHLAAAKPLDNSSSTCRVSLYTRGLAECLQTLERSDPTSGRDEQTLKHLLCNLLQGRILEHLRQRLIEHFELDQNDSGERVSLLLIDVFKEEIFGTFRRRIEEQPELLTQIAQEIVATEIQSGQELPEQTKQLYERILQKYLNYSDLGAILRILQADGRLENLILTSMLHKNGMHSTKDFPPREV
ncbi:MAG: hypothetical protein CMN54_03565 [SAR324 cluster bacterium]|uniref:Uncharacterized protein n=1 Tax=SAR324 cluster bacterium TaxID=2024889 RepID=A0A2D6YH68_9DELT|nr:hypothetical protein [SAR324 cluster bacterium]